MSRRLWLFAAAISALAATLPVLGQDTQFDDARNPHYKQAQQDLDNNNAVGAASDYEAALAANPELVEAHYQLGMIYAEKLQDPVSAIYHFKHYLAAAPNADHAPNAKQMIDMQKRIFAATVPPEPGSEDPATLQTENSALKKQASDAARTITQLQAQLSRADAQLAAAAVAPPPAVASTAGAAPASGAVAAGPLKALPLDAPNPALEGTNAAPDAAAATGVDTANAKTYKVVKGDSLWKIAHKMYPGDTKNGVDKIQEANKDSIGGKPLKIGQVLLIPQ